MSGWGPPPGGAGQGGQPGGWGSPPPGGGQGGQGGWGGTPPPPPPPQGPQDPYGQQPYGPSGPQNPYGGQPQDPYGQPYQPQQPQQPQPGWGQPGPQQPQPGGPQPGWGAPGDPYGQQPGYGPPPQKKKTGLILGIVGGGVGLVVIVVVAIVVISLMNSGPDYKIVTPDTAGGLQRDRTAESQSPQIGQQKDRLKGIAGGKIKEVLTAIYSDGSSSSSSSGLSGKVFFLGATAKEKIDQDGFMNGFKRGVGSQMQVKSVDAGELGGQAACATSSLGSTSTSVCIWVDDSTFGEIVPSGKSPEEAASLMLKMRSDIEQKM